MTGSTSGFLVYVDDLEGHPVSLSMMMIKYIA